MQEPPANSREIEARVRQACAEVARLTARGVDQAARQVLHETPGLAEYEEAAIEIIYSEYQTLDELGKRPEATQWLDAYPEHRARLQRLVQLHDLLDESVELPPAAPTQRVSSTSTTNSNTNPASAGARVDPTLDVIGDYELLEELGRGGMGVVYRARQCGLSRLVAVKVLRNVDHLSSDRSRFQQEAETIATLQHPNIVQVYEVGADQGRDFLSMELIQGGSLELWSQGPPRSYHEIALLIKQLADAIEYAHRAGIVHRDLKPANVLMTQRGEPKLVDFGLAKRLDAAARVHTQTGAVLGTPSYMSPEQAAGESQIGPATDVFSIGVMLYQLMTGRLPFEGNSAVETLKLIAERDPISPSKHRSSVPRDLETICWKCLAKDSQDRYGSAQALADDLARFLDHRPIHARRATFFERTARTIKRHPAIAALAAALAVLFVSALGYVLWQQEHLRQAQQRADSQTRMASQQRERANQAEQAYETSLLKARELVGRTTDLGMKLANEPGWDETRRKAFEDAASYYEEFLKQHAEDPTIRREAAQAAMRSASLHTELGRWTESETRLNNANQWLSEMPYDRQAQWLRTDCLLQLAIVNWRLERHSQAEQFFGQTISLMNELLASNPDEARFLLRLSNAQTNLCALIRGQRRLDECISLYFQAIDNCLHAARATLGLDPLPSGDEPSNVEEKLQQRIHESIELRKRVAGDLMQRAKTSTISDAFAELALTLDDMSSVLSSQKITPAAEQALRESVELRRAVARLVQNSRFIEHYLARGLSNLGSMLLINGKHTEANQAVVEAEKLFADLVRDFPDRIHHKREWAFALNNLARSYTLEQNHDRAIQVSEQAVKLHEQLAASQPGNEWMRRDLVSSLKGLASCYLAARQRDKALIQYQRMLEVLPDDAGVRNSFAWTLILDPAVNQSEATKALELSRQATEMVSNNNNYWNTLALAFYRAAERSESTETRRKHLQDAKAAVERAEELASGGTIADWFIHSLILAGIGQGDAGRQWYDRAETGRLAQAPNDVELLQFSRESTAALQAALATGTSLPKGVGNE